ncbi:MAG: hypothetical protein AVDCRST_MAG68-4860 [uncultured Gemmatimonadetes bacterium]|uniref:Uncharacterized protein n=1 Tax=uncultured Gemmatimonadota bacterium TaxID=203437 RepID=A0A6J4MQL5_9BACT|nr:MAG: hypothetical protein AVDCRST_MAG68-4860 [uncultured Gemmatimonadota bacterium]
MPEISPELAARIESLRSSHRENPARFFMPLASAYREAGELGQAEELLRENLKRHPGYLSAHVLLGRCLADRGALGEARNEFSYVLSIDPQNLIALRTLGEMAAANGNADEARRWYGELLAVDPMSAEARQALDALDSAPPAAPARGEEEGGWDPFAHGDVAQAPAEEPASEAPGFEDEPLLDAPGFRPLEPAPELGFGSVDLPPPANDDFANWGDVSLDAPSAAPADLPAAPAGGDALDFGAVELSDDWGAAPEPLAADPSAGWGMFDDAPGADIPAEPLPELRSFHDEDAAEDGVEMVTETMAELYYRQGFVDRAADVYRELIARRGDEPALTRRLAELEAEMRGDVGGSPEPGFGDAPGFTAQPGFAPEYDAPIFTSEPQQAPAWLEAVDAHMVAGDAPGFQPETAGDLPALDLPAFAQDDVPSSAAAQPAHGGATGDSFADSFAAGFDGSAQTPPPLPALDTPADGLERDPWTAPTIEPTAAPGFDAQPGDVFRAGQPADSFFEPANALGAQPADVFDAQSSNAFDAEPAAAPFAEPLPSFADADVPPAEPLPSFADADAPYAEPLPSFAAADAPPAEPLPSFADADAPLPSFADADAPDQEPEPSFAAPGAPHAEPAYAAPAEVAAAETVRAEHRAGDGTESVATYLWSILSWRPGQAAAYAQPEQHAEPEQAASDSQPFAVDAEPAVPESLYTDAEIEPSSLAFESVEPARTSDADAAPALPDFASAEPAPLAFEADPAPLAFESAEPAPYDFTDAGTSPAEPAPYDFTDAGTSLAEPAPFDLAQQADAGAPPPPQPWDDATLGAPEQQPPLDEPWMADAAEPAGDEPWAAAEPELTPANDDDEPWAIPAAPTEALLPEDDEQGPIDELPWLAAEPGADDSVHSVDDYAPAGTEAASGTPAGDEPMPWEMGLELGAPEPAPTPAPAQPVGGFSFEDFFSEPVPEPAPAQPAAEPQPAPAAPQADAAASDEDEDLESFQAWLQSLKR